MSTVEGSEITDITIDGNIVKEITVGGDIVYTNLTIPTDHFAEYLMESGSGTTLADTHGNDGSHDGSYITQSAVGNHALKLDVGDSARIPHNSNHTYDTQAGGDSLTISMWIRVFDESGTGRIINKWNEIAGDPYSVVIYGTKTETTFSHYDGENQSRYSVSGIDLTTLTHVAYVVDQSDETIKIYVGGELQNTFPIDTGIGSTRNTFDIYIGKRVNVGNSNGIVLDSMRWYSRPVSENEITDLAQEQ